MPTEDLRNARAHGPPQVVNARSALLSNFEVLTLLKEHESEQLVRQKTALRVKKEEEASGVQSYHINVEEAGENLRTVEFEVCGEMNGISPSRVPTMRPLGNPIPFGRVPAACRTNRSRRSTTDQEHLALCIDQGREAADREPRTPRPY